MLIHGVVLGSELKEQKWSIVTLVSTGETWTHAKDDIAFVIPAHVPNDLAARCGTSESARTHKELMARVEVLRRIRDVEKAVENAYNTVGRSIHTVYPQVKSPHADEWSKVTVAQAVQLFQPAVEPSLMIAFAIHKHLMRLNKEFVPDYYSYRTSQLFNVRPETHVDTIKKVVEMSRTKDGSIDAFSRRVREVTASNRARALESWSEPPSQQQVDGSAFTADDRVIIDFLQQSVRARPASQADPYELGLSAIIKKLDAYTGTVDSSVVYQVLVDIGIFPPWQDVVSNATRFDFHQYVEEPLIDREERAKTSSHSQRALRIPTGLRGPDGLYQHDPAQLVRHDFGEMPVYVIDDVTAEELDDGISFEAIPSEPDSGWVHVHIADPTAVIPLTHGLARHARNQLETVYFLHQTCPMLPQSIVRGRLTLGSSLETGVPERVLTFSFKIDSEGAIADYKVRHGLIRNIHLLDYNGVDLALGLEPPQICYPFGAPESQPSSPGRLDGSHLDNLHSLHRIANRLVAARLKLPTFIQSPSNLSISLSTKPPDAFPIDYTKSTLFRGFPNVIYRSLSNQGLDYGARRLVSELMKATCRIASRFCLDHNLPVLRRTSSRIITRSESDFEKLLSIRDSDGYVDYLEAMRMGAVTPAAEYMLEPKMHWSLGVPEGEGYVRVTSPLRRYSDLMSHWQIKHALLGSRGKLPFSKEFLQDHGKNAIIRERLRKRSIQNHGKFWALLFIRRWLQHHDPSRTDNRIDPLTDLVGISVSTPAQNLRTKDFQCRVRLPKLGFDAVLAGLDVQSDIPLGTEVPIKIESITLGQKPQLRVVRRL